MFMREIIHEAFLDSYTILPILFITYLLFEYFERHNHLESVKKLLSLKGLGPLIGAILGVFPQCGFSIAAAGLYVSNSISMGTMVAVFIATSDEAIPILMSYPNQIHTLLYLIVGKLILAFLAGLFIDMIYHPKKRIANIHDICEDEHENIVFVALKRTVKIFVFIFLINIILGVLISLVGEDHLSMLLMKDTFMQPFIAAVFGFIPNCAASIILTQLYIAESISFGSFTAGLITNAGLGMLVLLRSEQHRKDAMITGSYLLIVAFVCGLLLQQIM